MSEIELKFGIAAPSVPVIDRAMVGHGAVSVGLETSYWDTPDRRLSRAGVTLRLRKASGRWEQTVKAPGPSPAERLEETVVRTAVLAPVSPRPDLSLHAGTRAGRLIEKALTHGKREAAALELVHTTRVRRRLLVVESVGAEIEVAFDRGLIVAGDRSAPVCELEAELKHGDVEELVEFGHRSIDAHSIWLSTAAKSARGERLASGDEDRGRGVKAKRPDFGADASGPEIFRAAFLSCLDQVLANASTVASGSFDDSAVHQLRVGLRRLRTLWRELPDWREGLAGTWERPAAQAFRELGLYRDRRSVASSLLQPLAEAGSPHPELRTAHASHDVDPVEVVRSAEFQHALLDLLAFALDPEPARADRPHDAEEQETDPPPPRELIARHLGKLHRRLARDAERFGELPSFERHRVRKRLKRLRYVTELVAPLFGKRPVARFLAALEPAQEELGRYMDLVVAQQLAADVVAAGDARAWFNVGWLKAQEAAAIGRSASALRAVADAAPYWKQGGAARARKRPARHADDSKRHADVIVLSQSEGVGAGR